MRDEGKLAGGESVGVNARLGKFSLTDFIIVCVLGALTLVNIYLWHLPGIPPTSWADMAVIEGARPMVHITGGYWSIFVHFFYRFIGIRGLQLVGAVLASGMVVLCYGIIREILAIAMMSRPQFSFVRLTVMRTAAVFAAIAFLFSDIIWLNGQFLTETSVQMVLAMLSVEFFLVLLRKGQLRYGFLLAFLLGLLSAESFLGVMLLIVFLLAYKLVLERHSSLAEISFSPAVVELSKWHITFVFVFSVGIGIVLNCYAYDVYGGLVAHGQTIGSIPMKYANDYWAGVQGLADISGWVMWSGFFVVPIIISLLKYPSASDEEDMLSYATGTVFIACGLIALSQCCCIDSMWFWTYMPVRSTALLAFGSFLNSVTIALAISVFGVDAFCRKHALLLRNFNEDERGNFDREVGYSRGQIKFVRIVILCMLPLLFLVVVFPGRVKSTSKAMMEIVNDGVRAMVAECEDARYLISDGMLDCAVEIEARRQGKNLSCISLLTPNEADGSLLRTRGMTNAVDRFSFAADGGRGLRSWIRDYPENLANIACQLGFDLWKREGLAIPPIGGLVSRPKGWKDPKVAEAGLKNARALIDKYIAFYGISLDKKEDPVDDDKKSTGLRLRHGVDKSIKDAFLAVQWRLSRMCFYRGENYDLGGNSAAARAEVELSKLLDNHNDTYIRLMQMLVERNKQIMGQETPLEGLHRTLIEANFKSAKLYAELILESNPNHIDSNFAMAMFYAFEQQYSRSEFYFEKCIELVPAQPTFYNNLAMVQFESGKLDPSNGKLDQALVNVNRALALIPESAEVLDTKRQILKAIEERDAKAAEDAEKAEKDKAKGRGKPAR